MLTGPRSVSSSRRIGAPFSWTLIPEEGGDPLTPQDVYVHGQVVQILKWQGWAPGAKQRLEEVLREEAA